MSPFSTNNIVGEKLTSYKTFGGTNWGNLGYDYGYTSYDYAAVRKCHLQVAGNR